MGALLKDQRSSSLSSEQSNLMNRDVITNTIVKVNVHEVEGDPGQQLVKPNLQAVMKVV